MRKCSLAPPSHQKAFAYALGCGVTVLLTAHACGNLVDLHKLNSHQKVCRFLSAAADRDSVFNAPVNRTIRSNAFRKLLAEPVR